MDKITKVSVTTVPEPAGNIYSNCLKVGNILLLSGMIATDTSGDAYAQSVSCFEKIRELIEGAGGRMEDVAKLNVFLLDMKDRPAFGKARGEFFSGRMPCSTLVAISELAQPGALVEVEATAFPGAGV
jgi:enamine deaminase RidA (YjgF/YER057c/UK114 family)